LQIFGKNQFIEISRTKKNFFFKKEKNFGIFLSIVKKNFSFSQIFSVFLEKKKPAPFSGYFFSFFWKRKTKMRILVQILFFSKEKRSIFSFANLFANEKTFKKKLPH
jgi:hypothetical protein